MTTIAAKKFVLAARPHGTPKLTDFRLETTNLGAPADGQIILAVEFLSLDPYMRGRMDDKKSYSEPVKIGDVMTGETVARVVESKHKDFAAGDLVLAYTGWCTHAMSDGTGVRKIDSRFPISTRLGVLGMPGFTAYGGMRNIGQPKAGETVVVAAATGPVGSLVGQLAKVAGARAIGIAGGPEKCAFAKNELKFDAVIDHKSGNMARELAEQCPKGIDVYFENVGGAIWQAVLPLLNTFARVPVCGLIAGYSATSSGDGPDNLPATMRQVLTKSLTVRGFINYEFQKQYPEFIDEVGEGVKSGKIVYREDIVEGFENAPEAFIGMLGGKNFGKLLIKMTDTE